MARRRRARVSTVRAVRRPLAGRGFGPTVGFLCLAVLIGCGSDGSDDAGARDARDEASADVTNAPSSASTNADPASCETAPTPIAQVPDDVRLWAQDEGVVGADALWVGGPPISSWVTLDGSSLWRLKMGWYQSRPGELSVQAVLIDPVQDGPPLTAQGSVGEALATTEEAATWYPTVVEFPQPGCWKVVATLEGQESTVEFLIRIGGE